MPRLVPENIKRLELPSSTPDDKAWVDVDLAVNARVAASLMDGDTQGEQAIAALAVFIKAWNFEDDKGQVVPITQESVNRLSGADFGFIVDTLMTEINKQRESAKVGTEEKKA